MVGVIALFIAGATIVVPLTAWVLSLNEKIMNMDSKLEAMTLVFSEWNRLNTLSMEDIEAQKDNLDNYNIDGYTLSVSLGDKGVMTDGVCKTSGNSADATLDCYDNSKIAIKNSSGETLYSSKLLPLTTSGSGSSGGVAPAVDWSKPQSYTACYSTAGICTPHSVSFTCPTDGYVSTSTACDWANRGSPSCNFYFYLNGASVPSPLYVKKGDTISASDARAHITATFYPLR